MPGCDLVPIAPDKCSLAFMTVSGLSERIMGVAREDVAYAVRHCDGAGAR